MNKIKFYYLFLAIPLPAPQSMNRLVKISFNFFPLINSFLFQTNRTSDISPLSQKDMMHSYGPTSSIGFTGIYNPANSCFMNAALQCLSNTCELRDYFLRMKYSFNDFLFCF